MIHITISADVDRVSLEDATKLTALIKEISQIPTVTVVAVVDHSDVIPSGLLPSSVLQAVKHLAKLDMRDVVMASIERSEEEIVDALKQLSDSVQAMPFKPATAEIRDKQQQDRYRQRHHSKHLKK